jgi:hypothetical protein
MVTQLLRNVLSVIELEGLLPHSQETDTDCIVISCSGKGTGLGGLSNSQSVSFRQGTNVEFGTHTFATNGPHGRVVSVVSLGC